MARAQENKAGGEPGEAREPRRIIVCADDFGMNTAINEGIVRLARKGRITAVSCLTSAASFRDDARELGGLALDIGVHLNFTDPRFPSDPTLPLPSLLARACLHSLSPARISAQIERQLDVFEATLGHRPHFVDGHQHVHQFPQIRDALIGVLLRRYGDNLPWMRCSRPGFLEGLPFASRVKARLIGRLGGYRTARKAYDAGIRTNRALLGVYDFRGGLEAYVGLMLMWLSNAEDGDLIMCHPALPGSDDADHGRQRGAEFAVLNDDGFPASLQRKGLVLTRRP
ncbi:ChbG/HpnK family deacetylase [Achromobacter aloeverae]